MASDEICQMAMSKAIEALNAVAIVGTKQDSHEQTCGRRYEDGRLQSGRTEKAIEMLSLSIDSKVGSIYKILWTTSGTTIALLVSTVGILVFYLLTMKH